MFGKIHGFLGMGHCNVRRFLWLMDREAILHLLNSSQLPPVQFNIRGGKPHRMIALKSILMVHFWKRGIHLVLRWWREILIVHAWHDFQLVLTEEAQHFWKKLMQHVKQSFWLFEDPGKRSGNSVAHTLSRLVLNLEGDSFNVPHGVNGPPHWDALKWLLRYLDGSMNNGITFSKCDDGAKLIGYVDSNYDNDRDSRESKTSYVFTLCDACISWKSQLQYIVALSTNAFAYIATIEAFKEVIWLEGSIPIKGNDETKSDFRLGSSFGSSFKVEYFIKLWPMTHSGRPSPHHPSLHTLDGSPHTSWSTP
ncbi:Retrovirus-related Pol polyprotein from transposon TNT 1-94 [Sesamum angolense]|uniref:Retrovirus-related Pol polyprotein from transposon TNT 1-94 n=1 Tax=Sesamum angolense TaxID=2727404 RepID=A0AAE2BLS5_9LAMI|nr:Retrovirus-related Pol polyprotein from transposon TNT 1-94 [Sesamum angolense]